jgi:hypothetical protein
VRPKTFVGVIAAAVLQHRATEFTETHRENGVLVAAVLNERRGLTPVAASQIAETLQAAVRRPSAGVRWTRDPDSRTAWELSAALESGSPVHPPREARHGRFALCASL